MAVTQVDDEECLTSMASHPEIEHPSVICFGGQTDHHLWSQRENWLTWMQRLPLTQPLPFGVPVSCKRLEDARSKDEDDEGS